MSRLGTHSCKPHRSVVQSREDEAEITLLCAVGVLPEVAVFRGGVGWGGVGEGGHEQTSSWFSSSARTPLRPCSATITVAMQHRPNANVAKATDAPTLNMLLFFLEGPNYKRARSDGLPSTADFFFIKSRPTGWHVTVCRSLTDTAHVVQFPYHSYHD
jgi:hypothetical protein